MKWVALLFFAVIAEGAEISGDVFIVTKGRGAIKMPLVPVSAHKASEMDEHINARRIEQKKVMEFFKPADDFKDVGVCRRLIGPEMFATTNPIPAVRGMVAYALSEFWFLEGMPPPVAVSKTDADGKFVLNVPEGDYVLVASSSRKVFDDTEHYRWYVRAKPGPDIVHLANDNLSDSGSADSVLRTIDVTSEALEIIKDRDRAWLLAFIDQRAKAMPGEIAAEEAEKKAEQMRRENEAEQFEKEQALRSIVEAARKTIARDPKSANEVAVKHFPDLGIAGSPLNKEFLERVAKARATNPAAFSDPAWPVIFASESARALVTKPK